MKKWSKYFSLFVSLQKTKVPSCWRPILLSPWSHSTTNKMQATRLRDPSRLAQYAQWQTVEHTCDTRYPHKGDICFYWSWGPVVPPHNVRDYTEYVWIQPWERCTKSRASAFHGLTNLPLPVVTCYDLSIITTWVTCVLQMLETSCNVSRVPDTIEYVIFAQASGIA